MRACVQCVCRVCVVRVRRTFFALVQSAHRTLAWKPLAAKAVCSRTVKVKAPLQSLHTICWSCSVSAFLFDIVSRAPGSRGLANFSRIHAWDVTGSQKLE